MTHTFKVASCQYTIPFYNPSREAEIVIKANKAAKPRKPSLKADPRKYPIFRSDYTTRQYVYDYYRMNGDNQDIDTIFEPLSTRITPVEGEDTCEVME
jgi:hypothetical protein